MATKLTTKYGEIAVGATSSDHIYVTTNPGSGRDSDMLDLVINGKLYRGNLTAHLHRWSDGKFHIGEQKDHLAAYHSLYFDAGTEAARKTMRATLEAVINAWASSAAGRQEINEAQIVSVQNSLERALGKRIEALTALAAADAEIAALRTALANASAAL